MKQCLKALEFQRIAVRVFVIQKNYSIQTYQIRSSRLKQNNSPRIKHKLKVIINVLTPDKPRLR